METKPVWTEETIVKTYETDFQRRWKPASFFLAMQEAGGRHADHLGWGYKDLLARDMSWVLARSKIRFFEFPVVGDKIVLQTWPKGLQQRLFFMRDFFFFNESGKKLAAASSAYVLLSLAKRRILPPTALNGSLPENNGLRALDEPLEKISMAEAETEKLVVEAGYSAVDLMGHVNNARYVEWISDCFPIESHSAGQIDWLQINFTNEVKPGERISIGAGQLDHDDSQWSLQGSNLSTGAKAFEAGLRWSAAS